MVNTSISLATKCLNTLFVAVWCSYDIWEKKTHWGLHLKMYNYICNFPHLILKKTPKLTFLFLTYNSWLFAILADYRSDSLLHLEGKSLGKAAQGEVDII